MTLKKLDRTTRKQIDAVIEKNRKKIESIAGFADVEAGFPIVNGWIRRTPAIILFVKDKKPEDSLLPGQMAPKTLGGYPVDVIEIGPSRALRLVTGMDDGTAALAGGLTYQPIDGNPIDTRFTVTAKMTCHVGPDQGWPVLKKFLQGTQRKLVAAMYDLNADWISKTLVETIGAAGTNPRKMVLTWDDHMTNGEPEIRVDLKQALGTKLDAWIVQCGGSKRFSSAYHEKVAVRDSKAFWLSSGNWSRRSQPNIDPVANPAAVGGMFSKGNREWHLTLADKPLSKMFEKYIIYDRNKSEEENTALGVAQPMVFPDLFVPIEALVPDMGAALAAPVPVAAAQLPTHGQAYDIQPVLCPDNYIARITELVESAKTSLYLQYSYITWTDRAEDKLFRELLKTIGKLSHKGSFDLRIIVGNNDAPEKVRKLVENGFNEACIRVQSSIHNKAIIVDSKAVLVSSANWSGDGTLRNRDAGLIIYDPEITAYYEAVFLDDWDKRARADFGAALGAIIAEDNAPTPPGMVRIGWNDFFEE